MGFEVQGPSAKGPLAGFRIVEFEGLGPCPFAAMVLADLGADVVRIGRPGGRPDDIIGDGGAFVLHRGRPLLPLNLKAPGAREEVLDLIASADALIEGFRPGVMERLGFGPDDCLKRNPRLVYGRMTGWGQEGPLAQSAGHDINYIALTGALHAIGEPDRPPAVPLNLVGDFGGGSMFLVAGVLSALLRAGRTGEGQVVETAMVDGASLLMGMMYALHGDGRWEDRRGANLLDGGMPFYACYACADGRHVAVGALEPAFFAALVKGLGLEDKGLDQYDRAGWPAMRALFAATFAGKTRDAWAAQFEGSDACLSPVLSLAEAPHHPHMAARGIFRTRDGHTEPGAAPRFSATPTAVSEAPGETTVAEVLARWSRAAAPVSAPA